MRQIISTLSFIVSLSSFAAHPVEDLLNRIDSGASQKFVIIQTKSPTDFFEIYTVNGKPAITGNSTVNNAAGLNWYLKNYPHKQ